MNAALAVAITILFTAISQLLQKQVAILHRNKSSEISTLGFYLRAPTFWLALLCLGLGMLAWLFALSRLDVGKAYALLSVNYLLVPLAATFLFNERLPLRGWIGALLLCIGIVLIGKS
ncbi:MAG: 4-amino-4-deoxy-L-arabinose-phospho-UDP flippase [Verrucomicrobiaceae bacterium]|nr:4-amino-4-deoxy-L-arabinose-phospho-UDP flippase [Verrucomicrobiaceae bacterium]